MYYLVHYGNVEYYIHRDDTPAILWHVDTPLTFDVYTFSGWAPHGVIVSLNGVELAPNADGSYTIPGGRDYVKINCFARDPSVVPASSPQNVCGWCGKIHPNSLWGRIVAFFHMIFLFFRNLFRR